MLRLRSKRKLSVSIRTSQKFITERFNLKKLNDVKVKQRQLKISNRFAAFENLDDNTSINRAWESIRDQGTQFDRFTNELGTMDFSHGRVIGGFQYTRHTCIQTAKLFTIVLLDVSPC